MAKSPAEMSKEHVGATLATSTLDLKAFYYSVVAPPSTIVDTFVSHASDVPQLSPQGRTLTSLLDALHFRFAAEVSRVRPRPDVTGAELLPLPVGLPSSQILANLIMDVALSDVAELPNVIEVSAYADDVLILSTELPNIGEDVSDYFSRLGVIVTGEHQAVLASNSGQTLANLAVGTNKSETSYSRVQPNDEGAAEEVDDLSSIGDLDPYITGDPSPDWGGRLRTVLRSPFKRDRVPREIAREISRIADEIRVGVEPADAQSQLDELVPSLNGGDFLALRPLWSALIACSWYAGGAEAVDGLNYTLDVAVSSLEPPQSAQAELTETIRTGLRDAWAQAMSEALALRGTARWTVQSRPDSDLLYRAAGISLAELTRRAKRLREERFVSARFVSVPLAEFSEWPGPLFGPAAFRGFLEWAKTARAVDLSRSKRFVPLHDVCMANHLWVASNQATWLPRVLRLMRTQALIDPTMVDELGRRAANILRQTEASGVRTESISDYQLRIAIPSIEIVGEPQLRAVLANDHSALSLIARIARDRVTKVTNNAAYRRADVLVLPEWSVVRAQLSWLFSLSARNQMLVVTGEAPSVTNGVYSNRIWTGLPLVDAQGHRACLIPPPREKRYLSPGEQGALRSAGVSANTSAAPIPTYAWRGMTLASLICFEFADVRAREQLRADADVITVSSWNTDWRYFAAAQESTTRDNYCLSLCVNTSQYPGTTLMRPTRSAMAIAASVHGSSDPSVITRDVDMLPIVASRALGLRPSEIGGLPEPTDGIKLRDYAALPPML